LVSCGLIHAGSAVASARRDRAEALAIIFLNGSGEGGQQIAKHQVSHLVVLISRDPFLDGSDYE
jgi:hypothetical protein